MLSCFNLGVPHRPQLRDTSRPRRPCSQDNLCLLCRRRFTCAFCAKRVGKVCPFCFRVRRILDSLERMDRRGDVAHVRPRGLCSAFTPSVL
jgi:hypothetical protein